MEFRRVLFRSASRLIELDVSVDGDPLTRYRCDGLIVSSPTGSTAYSLAAGGAVVFPTAEVLALTPICPHTLSNRSLIVPLTATIEVKVISPATILSADGQVVRELATGDMITIRRARRTVRLMHLAGSSFCEALRCKLHWRGACLVIGMIASAALTSPPALIRRRAIAIATFSLPWK